MKKLMLLLGLLVMASGAMAEAPNQVWEEIRVPANTWTAYGNMTGTGGPIRIMPVATVGGGAFTVQLPNDVCTNQPIDPKLTWATNGTWANKTAVTFVMSYQVFKTSGHPQVTYTGTQTRNNTANLIKNSTVQVTQFAQIPPSKITPGGLLGVTVYRNGRATTDTAGNTTIPVGMSFKVLRCRAD